MGFRTETRIVGVGLSKRMTGEKLTNAASRIYDKSY